MIKLISAYVRVRAKSFFLKNWKKKGTQTGAPRMVILIKSTLEF
jgi:hypothetical protein